MVINHIEKLFVTNDAATILRELEIQHPAAKIVVMASQMQEKQVRLTSVGNLIPSTPIHRARERAE